MFLQKIDIGHVEAGLRTFDIHSPWPEEFNRQLTTKVARFHFAPTQLSKQNLIAENIPESNILITGNTIIDTLKLSLKNIDEKIYSEHFLKNYNIDVNIKFVLITGHRRENFGDGFVRICNSIRELSLKYPEINFIYPVHLNPNVKQSCLQNPRWN